MVTAYVVILSFLGLAQILTIFMIHHFSTEQRERMSDHGRHLRDLFDMIDGSRVMTKAEYDFQYGRIYSEKSPKPDPLSDAKPDN